MPVVLVSHGDLHDALAAAWDTYDATSIDIQLSYRRGTYMIHVLGLRGSAVVYVQVIEVRGDQEMPEATKATLLLMWIDTIQSRTARAVARGDAMVARFLGQKPAG